MNARAEQAALANQLRTEGATWARVAAEFRERWGLNARQTVRAGRGWSQAYVAKEWCRRWPNDPKTFKNVSTWERWPEAGHMPSLVVLDKLAQIYECSVADLVADFDDYSQTSDDDNVDRRTFLIGALGSTVAAETPMLRHRHVAPELPDYFEAQLRSHYQADMLLGPHLVMATVTAQYQAICEAIALTTGGLHEALLRVAASYGALAGWLSQDAGDLATASAWRAETLEMAHRSGDPHLISYALTNKAMLRIEVRDGAGAIDLTAAALRLADLAPKVQVLALVQAAQGYSLIGDRDQCERSLDHAAELIPKVDDDWPWGNAFRRTPCYIDAQRATCYGRLGIADRSADLWGDVISQQPGGYRRDSGVYLARQATAFIDAGEPSAAIRPATQAMRCLHDTGSARMRLELARLADKAKPWQQTSVGRQLTEVLADA